MRLIISLKCCSSGSAKIIPKYLPPAQVLLQNVLALESGSRLYGDKTTIMRDIRTYQSDHEAVVSDMKPVRLAVIGTGVMGRKHAEGIIAHSRCSLVGMCDSDSSHRLVAESFKVPFYQDLETLLARERPQGAIIATPNGCHATVAEQCAQRSVHILIEKPIADSLSEAHRIVQVADDTGIEVLVGQHRRHNPLIQEVRSLVRDGALGKLVAVSVLWALLKPTDYYETDWRCRRPGGGPTLINLIHDLDSLRFICGEIRQVYAQSSSAVRNLEVEDSLNISLLFESGAMGSILASDATSSPWSYEATTHENPYYFHTDENCYHFLGTSGSLAFPKMELWRYADETRSGWQHPIVKSHSKVTPSDPLNSQLEHFCRVVSDGETPLVDARDGMRSLAVALAVLESIQRQVPLTLAVS